MNEEKRAVDEILAAERAYRKAIIDEIDALEARLNEGQTAMSQNDLIRFEEKLNHLYEKWQTAWDNGTT